MKRITILLIITGLILVICSAISISAETKKETTAKKDVKVKTAVKEWRDTFKVNKKHLGAVGENTYWILKPGYKLIFKDGDITDTLTVLSETKLIDGVNVAIIEDREEKNGQSFEVTKDYYAIDTVTNDLYYFGEDVDYYKDGKISGHGGTWISGEKGAHFGLMMPGKIKKGDKFYNELAPKEAMDRVEIKETGLTVETPAGKFTNCIKMEETTPLEPDVKDYKIYAPGVGMVKDGDMPLIKIEKATK